MNTVLMNSIQKKRLGNVYFSTGSSKKLVNSRQSFVKQITDKLEIRLKTYQGSNFTESSTYLMDRRHSLSFSTEETCIL